MSDLNAAFEAAVANSKNLSERPDNATLLRAMLIKVHRCRFSNVIRR